MKKIIKKIKTERGYGYIMECKECEQQFRIKKWDYDNLGKGTFCSNKCRGKFQSENFIGDNNPNWKGGKIQIRCIVCGIRKMVKRKYAKKGGKYCSRECKDRDNGRILKECYSKNPELKNKTKHIGEQNGRWLGGKSFEPYTKEFNEELKSKVRDRDKRVCRLCNKKEKELKESLNVHHIDYNKSNSKVSNLISLCNQCHTKTNGNRNYWKNYLSSLIVNTSKDIV